MDPAAGDTPSVIPIQKISPSAPSMAIADVDNDRVPELFYTIDWRTFDPAHGRIVCLNVDGTTRWISDDHHIDKKR